MEPMSPSFDGCAVPGISEPSLITAYDPIVEHVGHARCDGRGLDLDGMRVVEQRAVRTPPSS